MTASRHSVQSSKFDVQRSTFAAATSKRRLSRRCLILLILPCILLTACYLARAPILTAIAIAWVIDEPITQADAVVALGGGLQTRTFEAARLYHAGFARKVLYVQSETRPTDKLGITEAENVLFKRLLLKKKVPAAAIIGVGNESTSTYEDVLAIRDWMLQNGARTLIVPTEYFHTRRAQWITSTMRRN